MKPQVNKHLVMAVGQARIAGTTIGHVITRTNGQSEYRLYSWSDLVQFLKAYHGEWEDSSEAMWGFYRSEFAPTTLKCFLNWMEAGSPLDVIAYCKQNISDILDQRWKYNEAKAMEVQDVPPLFVSHQGWGNPPREFSIETTLELNLNQRFPRA